MPYKFDFDRTNRIIRCSIEGLVTDETLKDYYLAIAKFGESNSGYRGIFDMSAVTHVNISTQTIRELANLPPALPQPDLPRCIVAGTSELFGLARMFDLQGSATRPNLHVVRTGREALAILGITDAKFEP
ncbi:MAG: hypothetical protein WAJ92_14655 [Candidatus Acidiferrales bacterium]